MTFSAFQVNIPRAASKCILVPFERYGRPKKCAQKSSCNTFFMNISSKNQMKHSLRILKNKKPFHETQIGKVFKSGPSKICGIQPLKNLLGPLLNTLPQISFPKCNEHRIFMGLQLHWGFLGITILYYTILNYPILNFNKTVCPKNVWMRHWFSFYTPWKYN